ncbi:MAG TPA: glucokinase [Stellaceae bacterium]|nr:glucokinase [Stellaceae bacterium]
MAPRLIGDIGATNARFALADAEGRIEDPRVFADDDYSDIETAIEAYLVASRAAAPQEAALAVASPITGDLVTLTNHPWTFSISRLKQRLGLARLLVVNDFTANALAMPRLGPSDRIPVGGGEPVADTPIAVLGPGSGLGMGAVVPTPTGWMALPGEGGHQTMPAADAREAAVLDQLRRRFDHVSAERVLSGQGLVNLYQTLAGLDGALAAPLTPAQITDRVIGESDRHARDAVAMFCAMLGTIAGSLALTLGARGGVYIAGGIVPRLGPTFVASDFRARFEAMGRFRTYLAAIPTYVVTHPTPAFPGLVALLEQAPAETAGH